MPRADVDPEVAAAVVSVYESLQQLAVDIEAEFGVNSKEGKESRRMIEYFDRLYSRIAE